MRTYKETLDYFAKLVYTYEKLDGKRMKNTYFIVPEGLIAMNYGVHIDTVRKDVRAAADSIGE